MCCLFSYPFLSKVSLAGVSIALVCADSGAVLDASTGQGPAGRLCKVAKVQKEQRLPDTGASVGASGRVLDVLALELVCMLDSHWSELASVTR